MNIARALTPLHDIAPRVMTNVSDDELETIRELFMVWRSKYPRNALRSVYYDGKMPVKDLGISTPPQVQARVKAVLGWPEKAVRALAMRNVFDSFVTPGATQDPFELDEILEANRFDLELPQAIVSAYKHSCSFITTARGDTQSGEPEVLIMARAADWSAGLWDKRRRALKAVLAITDNNSEGQPTAFEVYLPDVVLSCVRRPSGSWLAERRPNPLGEVLVEPLVYDPQLDRPFGRSRITRAVMSITDNALRTILRTEVSAEFYAAPRMAALGVTEDAFAHGKWAAAIDRWFAITKDEDGDTPKIEQFPQMSMQPLTDLYRSYASQFASETGLAVSSLGIVQDNPPSAEAMYAAEKDLIVEARYSNRVLGGALQRVAQRVVGLRDGVNAVTSEVRSLRANWVSPAFTSPVTAADALVKLNQVFPWLGETEVALEYAGFTQAEVTRLLSDKRRAGANGVLAQLLAGQSTTEEDGAGTVEDAAELKAKFDALGVAIRAGVDPDDAANRLGVSGIKFTGAVPVSLRMPEREATALEDR